MKLSDFDYSYPEDLVAQRPLSLRDSSRMMVTLRQGQAMRHERVSSLDTMLREGDLLVVNDTRVIPARVFGQRDNGGKIELLVVEPTPGSPEVWRCLLARARRMRAGEKIYFGVRANATVLGREGAFVLVEFKQGVLDLVMKHHGVPPLPPYIKREGIEAYTDEDRERYQTVYAREPGSAAAPTAGLHLSEHLFESLDRRGVSITSVTLHVGIDTFTPVRVDDVNLHQMHGERVNIPEVAAREIARAKHDGRRVVAVGTTAVRALESAARRNAPAGAIAHGSWVTDLYILPGFDFQVVDALLTNFHQPRSTLLMMVSAFAGRDFILRCYEDAIRKRYRLFSYGDCMLIL